jgi:hypothetical protein
MFLAEPLQHSATFFGSLFANSARASRIDAVQAGFGTRSI